MRAGDSMTSTQGPPRRSALVVRRLLTAAVTILVVLGPSASLGADGQRADGDSVFEGLDGLLYSFSPPVVLGADGVRFYGPDFDLACAYGDRLVQGMRNLSRLARLIERSGRRVIFTVVPNKSTVMGAELEDVPHGTCDDVGLDQQRRLLERYRDPRYLALPGLLARDHRKTYWNTDLHWTSLGATNFTKALASRLDPQLGRRQTYRHGTLTGIGGLNALLHDPEEETVPTAEPGREVKVSPRKVAATVAYNTTWRTHPAQRTWPGRTLAVGDSMMAVSLTTLRPIFQRGRFMWLGHVDTADIAREVAKADTVVLETIQLFVPDNDLATEQFYRQVKHALHRR
jgi:hypothetical protein